MELSFEIDKITESIELAQTGERLETVISIAKEQDLKIATKKDGWKFNWKQEFNQQQRQVYKLATEKEPDLIQGFVSLEIREKDKRQNISRRLRQPRCIRMQIIHRIWL